MTAAAAQAEIGHNSAAVRETLAKDPALLFREKEMLPMLLEAIEKDIAAHKPDLSTEKGRKAIASLAFDIAKEKNALDKAGKALNVDLRKQIDTTDAVRRQAWDALEKLQEKARAPLNEWEQKEDDRKAYVTETRGIYADAMRLSVDATYGEISDMVLAVEERALHPEMLLDLLETASSEAQTAISHLAGLKARKDQAEADRRELERLRAEKEEAERKAREAAAKEASEKAEAERIAAVEKAAAERAATEERRKAEEAERAAQAKRDAEAAEERRKAQAEIDEANRKAREAEEARLAVERKAEAERQERERQERAEVARKAAAEAEAERRRRDQEHRSNIMRGAKEAIMTHGKVSEDAAKAIVLAIVGGSVPNVTLEF